jgi:hypothetical protein
MPDIRNTQRFIRKMVQLENIYQRDIRRVQNEARRSMLDILTRNGINYTTSRLLRNEIDTVGRSAAKIGRDITTSVDDTVIKNLDLQMKELKKVGEDVVETSQIIAVTQPARMQVYQTTLQEIPQWVNDMAQSMDINMTRLIVAGAPIEQAIDRLFSVSIADGRASVWRLSNAAMERQTSNLSWIASMLASTIVYNQMQSMTQTVYKKQAIATVDEKTTDCCLRVHGQIQPLDKPFHLVGEPRFADKIDNPPFHWYCRTAQALYTERMESRGVPTSEMVIAARAELRAREETGKRTIIRPSSATSKR